MGNLIVLVLAAFMAFTATATICLRKRDRMFCIVYLVITFSLAAGIFLIRHVSDDDIGRWKSVVKNEAQIQSVSIEEDIFQKTATVVWDSGQEEILYADSIRYSGSVSEITVKKDRFDILAVIPEKYKKN